MEIIHETIYEHATGNKTFTVTAIENWSISMMHRLKEKYPDEVDIQHTNPDGSMVVRLPFEWMRVIPKRRDTMNDEERQIRSERMKKLRAS